MKRKRILYIILICIIFLLNATIQDASDDFVFKEGIRTYGSLKGWLEFYGENWGGRLIPHGILVLLLQLPNWTFVLANSIVFILFLHMLIKCFLPNLQKSDIPMELLCAVIFVTLIPQSILSGAVFWKCAAVLYLWGFAGFLYACYPVIMLYRKQAERLTLLDYCLAFLGGLYAGSFEQIAAFLTVFMIVLMLWNMVINHYWNVQCIILTLFITGCTLFFALMPGNSVRSTAETIRYFPNYTMYSIWDKLNMGIWNLLNYLQTYCSYIMVFISVMVARWLFKYTNYRMAKGLSVGVCGYYMLSLVSYWTRYKTINNLPELNALFNLLNFNTVYFSYDTKKLITTILAFGAFSTLGFLLMLIPTEKEMDILKTLLYFGGSGTIVLMGFAPTIYASSTRTLFIGMVMLIFVAIMVGIEVFDIRCIQDTMPCVKKEEELLRKAKKSS